MGNTLVFTPLFLERMFIRIPQKTMSCLISRKFFGGNNYTHIFVLFGSRIRYVLILFTLYPVRLFYI